MAVHDIERVVLKRQLVSAGRLEADPVLASGDTIPVDEDIPAALEHGGVDVDGSDVAAGGADDLSEGGGDGARAGTDVEERE